MFEVRKGEKGGGGGGPKIIRMEFCLIWYIMILIIFKNSSISHSCLTPHNIILTENNKKYKIIGVSSLYYVD